MSEWAGPGPHSQLKELTTVYGTWYSPRCSSDSCCMGTEVLETVSEVNENWLNWSIRLAFASASELSTLFSQVAGSWAKSVIKWELWCCEDGRSLIIRIITFQHFDLMLSSWGQPTAKRYCSHKWDELESIQHLEIFKIIYNASLSTTRGKTWKWLCLMHHVCASHEIQAHPFPQDLLPLQTWIDNLFRDWSRTTMNPMVAKILILSCMKGTEQSYVHNQMINRITNLQSRSACTFLGKIHDKASYV